MKFTQKTAEDLLTSWQTLSSQVRDKFIGDVLFPLEYSKTNPPRFSENFKNDTDTDKLIIKLMAAGFDVKTESLPRSTLSVVRYGGVVVPPMPAHKAIGFLGYYLAVLSGEE